MRKSLRPRIPTALLLVGVAVLLSSCGWSLWDSPMTTVRPKSGFGRMTNEIFMLISWWTLGIGIAVEAGLLWVCYRYRERPGQPIPKQVHGHALLEVSWTIAFAVILLIFAVPTISVIFETQAAPPPTALRVDVSGRQWWWEFKYPDLKIVTANELHLPAGQTISFNLHAPDVIHSFWMPQLGGKRDVVPGRVNRITLAPDGPGEFPGQCAEYCGMSHANMRFRVIVHDKAGFDEWVANQQKPALTPTHPLAQKGLEVFSQNACVGCHTIAGVSGGALGPNLTHFGSRKTMGANLMAATPENVAKWIENPGHMKPGALMPDLGMRGEQTQALAAYLLSLK
ncbi:MAG TPA: cytochrome c oxidase subunit II [Candidatus Bathyarchaeia archaeon]|nr:cytochrome c oxidase subunit II [Candidatus Bathyarchaeia archaeon]